MARSEQVIIRKATILKKLLIILFILFGAAATAQRDINHWQLSALGGGFYFDENLSNSLEGIEEPGFYTLGLRIQKRIGTDFQLGLSFLENRLRDDSDVAVRITNLNLAYNWDNGYLLSQRSVVSPYHLLGIGFRSRGSGNDVNLENVRGLLSLENGIKVRVGDNWSTQVGFVVNWNSENESFDGVFNSGYNYGGVVGVSYHFGAVKTKYKGPVFNAGNEFRNDSERPTNLIGKISPISDQDPAADAQVSGLNKIEKPSKETNELIERQNRLIENQNEFIQMMLSRENSGDLDSLLVLEIEGLDTIGAESRIKQVKRQSQEVFTTQDSIAMLRITEIDSAHVTQWKDGDGEQYSDTIYIFQSVDSFKVGAMENRLKQLEEENQRLKREREIGKVVASPADTVFAREGGNAEQIDQLEKRLNQLEEENKNLKENDRANSEIGEVNKVPSESDQALLEETKRRNDLLEQQVAATQKLAEKSVEPTQVVIDEQRSNGGGGVNLQPGIVVPIGGGGGSRRDNKEILENQKEMEARVDSLIRVISNMRAEQAPTVTPIGETNTSRNNNVVIAPIRSADTDTTANDSIPTDSTAMDSLGLATTVQPTDSIIADTLGLGDYLEMLGDTLNNPKIESERVELADSLLAEVVGDTIAKSDTTVVLENQPTEPSLDYPVSVFFGLNSLSLSTQDQSELKEVAVDLASNPESKIVLEGHTDKSGNASYNEMLSKKRADAVKSFLIENGVDSSRITITPLGSKNADKAYNENSRRVDILVDGR
jgi:outer membrane protein OmpA-like peptidoglycan-associated protein